MGAAIPDVAGNACRAHAFVSLTDCLHSPSLNGRKFLLGNEESLD